MDAPTLLTHRLGWGRAIAYAVLVLAALGALDGLRRWPLDRLDLAAILVAVAVGCVAYVLGIRPAVAETAAALEIRNPLRTTIVPWADITGLRSEDVLVVETKDREIRCFALPRRDRQSLVAGRLAGQDAPVDTSDLVRSRLSRQAAIFTSDESASVRTAYATPALAGLTVAVVAAVLAVMAGRGS